jgi:hypothetical protein
MGDMFTVGDSVRRTHYEGDSLREAYDTWLMLALVHTSYVRKVTDTDCGRGATLDWDDGIDHPVRLQDSSCGGRWCATCNPEQATADY